MDLSGWQYKKRKFMRAASLWLDDHEPLVKITEYTVMIVVVAITVLQIAWPSSRLLPLVRVGGERVGSSSREQLGRHVTDLYENATLSVRTATKHFDLPLEEAGITIDAANTAKKAASYPFWQRIIPLSSVFISLHRNTAPVISFDSEKAQGLADKVAKEGAVASVDAKIIADKGKAKLVPSQPSKSYPASATVAALMDADYSPATTLELKAIESPAKRGDDAVRQHVDEAQRAIDTPLTLAFESQKAKPDKKTVGSWLTFTETPPAYDLQIGFKQDAVNAYLQSVETKIYKAPGVTKVHTIDDREVDRTTGEDGHGILLDKAFESISVAVRKGSKTTLVLATGKLEPSLEYNRQYSNTDQKLVSLLNTVQSAHAGYGVSVMEINGRSANFNGDKQFETASTYKLFVAYSVLKAIDNGQMHWSDSSAGGRTVEKCFEDMIVISDNACPVAFKTKLGGWQVIENQMHSLGLSGKTSLTGPILLSTANDLSYFLYRLQNGTLLSTADTDLLLGLMKRQTYRDGIPAGTGLPVADKVGFVDNVIHDAGIVYAAKGPYVMVVMTANSSWAGIADTARTINAGL